LIRPNQRPKGSFGKHIHVGLAVKYGIFFACWKLLTIKVIYKLGVGLPIIPLSSGPGFWSRQVLSSKPHYPILRTMSI